MKIREIYLYIPLVIINLYALYLSQSDRNSYVLLFDTEDNFAEWLTVSLLLMLAAVCLYRCIRSLHFNRVHALANAFYATVFLFVAGEEISWGQRIFNFESSEWIKRNSYQDELNLHNLLVFDVRLTTILEIFWVTFMVIYFFVIAPRYWKGSRVSGFIDKFAFPVPALHQVVFFLMLFLCIDVFLYLDGIRSGEHLEMNLVYIYLIIFLYPYNHYRYHRDT